MKKSFLYGFCALITISTHASNASEEWITIFVHGSMGDTLRPSYFFHLFKCDLEGTEYKCRTVKRRGEKRWWRFQPAQEVGLRKIKTDEPIHSAAQLFAKLYDEMQKKFFPEQKTLGYYTFGWSGLVNHRERMQTAELFYNELKELVKELKHKHPHLKIRILGYSHGANVTLNMIHARNKDLEPDFHIDELILVAPPVQREHHCHVVDSFFEKVYNIYSRADSFQCLDCFSNMGSFSKRRFSNNRFCCARDQIQQIEVKLTIPACMDEKVKSFSKRRIDRSPGHIELWYFQELCECGEEGTFVPCYEPSFYRRYFPLHPLPYGIFIPGIIKNSPYTETIFELQPDRGKAVIRERYHKTKETIDFLSKEKIEKMRVEATPSRDNP